MSVLVLDPLEGMKVLADQVAELRAELKERRQRISAYERLQRERDRYREVLEQIADGRPYSMQALVDLASSAIGGTR